MNRTVLIILIAVLVVLVLCCCVLVAAFMVLGISGAALSGIDLGMPSIFTENVTFPEDRFYPPSDEAFEMVETLSGVHIPENSYADLSFRLEGITEVPTTVPGKVFEVGDTEQFWLMNNAEDKNFQVMARLVMETPHVFFWVEEGLSYDETEVRRLVDTFEEQIYALNREFFGSEWNPGIDNDEHIYLVYAGGLGGNVAGYFSAIDSIHPILQPYSNAHETFMINADAVDLGEDYIYSVLAHEFQHMIHWYQDRNETSWMNEGFSELAVSLNGYPVGGWHTVYLADRDIQLNYWPVEPTAQGVHYGSSYLFMQYFLDRFGSDLTQALVQEDLDGLSSIDAVMEKQGIPSAAGEGWLDAEELFVDWTVATTINDPSVADGQYAYADGSALGLGGNLFSTRVDCGSTGWQEQDVSQYGVEEFKLQCDMPAVLRFEAVGEVGLLPDAPYRGENAFWSNRNDESDTHITREFDLRDVDQDVFLDYSVWYDIEEDYDYAYVLASTDGVRWEMLETKYGTDRDPNASNYGWGYTGTSDGWVQESVDLSEYAGEVVQIRFEYVTDPNLNGEGLLLDEVRIDAIGYYSGFEEDDGGWQAEGFVRVSDSLAQRMAVTIIKTDRTETIVETLVFFGGETITIPLADIAEWDTVTLLVSGLTRYTTQPANFRFEFIAED